MKTGPQVTELDHIPEYFAKPGIVQMLAEAHPTLLIRQMANEILRLQAARPEEKECARLRGLIEERIKGLGGNHGQPHSGYDHDRSVAHSELSDLLAVFDAGQALVSPPGTYCNAAKESE